MQSPALLNCLTSGDWKLTLHRYSIWATVYDPGKPILLVPESQVLALLEEINTTFPKANVRITDYNREEGLVVNFDDVSQPELRPHFLGHSTSRDQIDSWTNSCPLLTPKMAASERTVAAFKAKIEALEQVSKNKSKAKKEQRHQEMHFQRYTTFDRDVGRFFSTVAEFRSGQQSLNIKRPARNQSGRTT